MLCNKPRMKYKYINNADAKYEVYHTGFTSRVDFSDGNFIVYSHADLVDISRGDLSKISPRQNINKELDDFCEKNISRYSSIEACN